MTSCAFKKHSASRPTRGKLVIQISILAFSLCFTPFTLECSSFRENPTFFRPLSDAEYMVLFGERLMAREVRCRGTD